MTSREKIPAAITAALADPTLAIPPMYKGLAAQLIPGALAQMPEDPDVLDDALARLAEQILGLRSDTAPPVEVVRGA